MEIKSFEDQFRDNLIALPDQDFYVIVGANNSGKSTFLREVAKTHKNIAYRVDVNRTILRGEGSQDKSYERNISSYLSTHQNQKDDNAQPTLQALQDFFRLKDVQRTSIIDWYNQYFPNRIYEEREDPENSASPMFLKVNGHPITKQGSGIRATLEIFIKLFDPTIKVLCIDEPELGLEPYLQKYLFGAIKDKAGRDKKIIIATHSHHFLDFVTPENNFVCERDNKNKIFITPVVDLKAIIFRLLGNTLSSFLLPENVIILEGPSDTTFLLKALLLLGKANYAIHNSRGNGNITYAMAAITQFLRFNHEHLPVYADRLNVIVDRPGRDILVREWRRKVPNPDRQICTLNKNGIEYYYPEKILQKTFNTTNDRRTIIDGYLASGNGSYNGIQVSKTELSRHAANDLKIEDLADDQNELFVFINSLS